MTKVAIIDTHTNQLKLDYYNNDNFLTVGVERGALDLIDKNIKLDLAIADFDHVTNEELDLIKKNAKKFVQLESHKDDLDGILAIEEVKKMGIKSIKYICEPTERMDMNLSVLQIMNDYDDVTIFNEKTLMMKLKAGKNELKFLTYQDYGIVSLYSLEDNNKVTIRNMKYETTDLNLKKFNTTAFSNEFKPYEDAEITSSKDLIVILTK